MRDRLLRISSHNREILGAIESSLFVLALDDYTHPPDGLGEYSPIKNVDLDAHIRNASSGMAGRNRWYDKCVSIFVESNARAGGMGEHSPCDGLVVGAMMHHSLCESIDNRRFERRYSASPQSTEGRPRSHGWERFEWVVDDQITTRCREAEQEARHISRDSDASMLWFDDYGARWIKDTGTLTSFRLENPAYSTSVQPNCPLTLTPKWPCNLRGTKFRVTSRRRMKRRRPRCFSTDAQKRFGRSAPRAGYLSRPCQIRDAQYARAGISHNHCLMFFPVLGSHPTASARGCRLRASCLHAGGNQGERDRSAPPRPPTPHARRRRGPALPGSVVFAQ